MHFCMCSGHLSSKVSQNWDSSKWLKEGLCCSEEFSYGAKLPSSYGFLQGRELQEFTQGKVRTEVVILHNFDVKPNTKFNVNVLLGFQIHFFGNSNNTLSCAPSLYQHVKNTLFVVQCPFWH